MKLTTYEEFLSNFDLPEKIDYETFCNNIRVRSGDLPGIVKSDKPKDLTTLKTLKQCYADVKRKDDEDFRNDNEEIYKVLYSWLVTDREHFLKEWFKSHIQVDESKLKDLMKVKVLPSDDIMIDGYINGKIKNSTTKIIKNINFDSMYKTKKLSPNDDLGIMIVLKNMMEKYVIRNSLIIPMGAKKLLERDLDGIFAILRGTTSRPSVFNPYTYGWILDNLFEGTRLFTPVLAWNSYQLAFQNSVKWKELVGTDVIPQIVDNGRLMSEWFDDKETKRAELQWDEPEYKRVELYLCPSEQLDDKHNFTEKYRDYFDAVLFSPPYFNLELYHSDNQSTDSFPKYTDWLEGYWDETCKLISSTLRPGGKFGFVISDFALGGETISKDMKVIAERHLTSIESYKIGWGGFSTLDSDKMKDGNFEDLWMFIKE